MNGKDTLFEYTKGSMWGHFGIVTSFSNEKCPVKSGSHAQRNEDVVNQKQKSLIIPISLHGRVYEGEGDLFCERQGGCDTKLVIERRCNGRECPE